MLPINRLPYSFDVAEALREIEGHPAWGKYPARTNNPESPHCETVDMWVRYNDPAPFVERGSWAGFDSPHDAVWLVDLPAVKRIVYTLFEHLEGGRLGGVLLTKLPAGGRIRAHTDGGWHATTFDKYLVPLQNGAGAVFGFDPVIIQPEVGACYAFRNDVSHWVDNGSDEDKISLIICIQQNKLTPEGLLCHGVL